MKIFNPTQGSDFGKLFSVISETALYLEHIKNENREVLFHDFPLYCRLSFERALIATGHFPDKTLLLNSTDDNYDTDDTDENIINLWKQSTIEASSIHLDEDHNVVRVEIREKQFYNTGEDYNIASLIDDIGKGKLIGVLEFNYMENTLQYQD